MKFDFYIELDLMNRRISDTFSWIKWNDSIEFDFINKDSITSSIESGQHYRIELNWIELMGMKCDGIPRDGWPVTIDATFVIPNQIRSNPVGCCLLALAFLFSSFLFSSCYRHISTVCLFAACSSAYVSRPLPNPFPIQLSPIRLLIIIIILNRKLSWLEIKCFCWWPKLDSNTVFKIKKKGYLTHCYALFFIL